MNAYKGIIYGWKVNYQTIGGKLKKFYSTFASNLMIDSNTRVICQGMTGKQGTFHTQQAIEYGTNMVAGISPSAAKYVESKSGHPSHLGLPLYQSVREAMDDVNPTAAVIYVPAPNSAAAIIECI